MQGLPAALGADAEHGAGASSSAAAGPRLAFQKNSPQLDNPREKHVTGANAMYQKWIGIGADTIDVIAVILILGYIVFATLNWLRHSIVRRRFGIEHYDAFRVALGRALLLGLEILVAADIVRTAALDPDLRNFEALGMLVVVRTFLSWSIVVEVEGRWPWQRRAQSAGRTPLE